MKPQRRALARVALARVALARVALARWPWPGWQEAGVTPRRLQASEGGCWGAGAFRGVEGISPRSAPPGSGARGLQLPRPDPRPSPCVSLLSSYWIRTQPSSMASS